jgi:guanylate kinase
MERMIANGEFLESTEFSSNLYGTRLLNKTSFISNQFFFDYFSKKAVEDVAQTGRICLLDVDKQGVKNIRKTELNPLFIYISPPSYEILEKRLRGRQTDSEAAIEKRLKEAKESMEFSKEPGMYDHIILNDQLEVAYQNLREILRQVKENLFRNFITNFLIGFFFFF